jgi:hypothetical protein
MQAAVGRPIPTGPIPNPGDFARLCLSFGVGGLCANLYLAISNGLGRSIGKTFLGLRLVVSAEHSRTPGFARGLVRSSLQAGPWMGALMLLTGAHDAFAGTTIVAAVDKSSEKEFVGTESRSLATDVSKVAAWKIALAVFLHVFFVYVFVFACAL